jgi:hypothetical protein
MGYRSILRVIPDAGVAVAVLTNGGRAVPVVQEIYDHVLGELVGVELPRFPTPPATPVPVDVEKVVGSVEPAGGRHPVIVLCGRDERGFVRRLHHGRAAARI